MIDTSLAFLCFPSNANVVAFSVIQVHLGAEEYESEVVLRWLPTVIFAVTKEQIYDRITLPWTAELL